MAFEREEGKAARARAHRCLVINHPSVGMQAAAAAAATEGPLPLPVTVTIRVEMEGGGGGGNNDTVASDVEREHRDYSE